jgi:hypothetical protein
MKHMSYILLPELNLTSGIIYYEDYPFKKEVVTCKVDCRTMR